MNYEDDTTVCVTFKDTTHNLGVMDLDRFSKVSLFNKELMRVYRRKMKFDDCSGLLFGSHGNQKMLKSLMMKISFSS